MPCAGLFLIYSKWLAGVKPEPGNNLDSPTLAGSSRQESEVGVESSHSAMEFRHLNSCLNCRAKYPPLLHFCSHGREIHGPITLMVSLVICKCQKSLLYICLQNGKSQSKLSDRHILRQHLKGSLLFVLWISTPTQTAVVR